MGRRIFAVLVALPLTALAGLTAGCNTSDVSVDPSESDLTQGGGAPDGKKDGTETDVDCGGSSAAKCGAGKGCAADSDCQEGRCTAGKCVPISATNGVKDGKETDVDCGGGEAPACADGKACGGPTDCESSVCTGGRCAAPTSSDGVANGTETDVDCGGGAPTNAAKCEAGKKCKAHADCASDGCGDDGKCATARSCAAQNGGRTCGAGEDCCAAPTVPRAAAQGGPFKLDKYSITAGRMRQFVERTNGDMRGYIQKNRPAGFPAAWDQYLPNRVGNKNDAEEYATVVSELGPVIHGTPGGGNMGCYISNQDYGARTYHLPADVNQAMCEPGKTCGQKYDQATLDKKMLNCVTFYVLSAFCAWDGGRLASIEEMNLAWSGVGGSRTYPWGNSPAPAGYNNAYPNKDNWPLAPANGDVARANYNYNHWSPAVVQGLDQSIYIAIPGSFPAGAGPYGHQDLAGGVFDISRDQSGGNATWFKNGSWQGHGIGGAPFAKGATAKYWAAGGRCSR